VCVCERERGLRNPILFSRPSLLLSTHTHTLFHSFTHTHTHTHTHSHTLTCTLSLSLSIPMSLSISLTHTRTHTRIYTHTHTHTHIHAHAHTHTPTNSLKWMWCVTQQFWHVARVAKVLTNKSKWVHFDNWNKIMIEWLNNVKPFYLWYLRGKKSKSRSQSCEIILNK